MSTEFNAKDLMHRIKAKFYPAYLPDAKKRYNLRTETQTELNILDIASKAEAYNFTTPPKVIEEGLSAGMQLIKYLAADGYHIKTPIFNLRVSVPGEYDGTETRLPAGILPKGRLNLAAEAREYFANHVTVEINGKEDNAGYIATFSDKRTDETNTVITPGGLFILRGIGLKITSDEEHADQVGLYCEDAETGTRLRQDMRNIVQNEPTVISGQAPSDLSSGKSYYIVIRTQSQVRGSILLKHIREVKSEFTVTVSPTGQKEAP
jgi:hypothetical protein